MNLTQLLGFMGTGLVAIAYIPQVHHLIKEYCSAGISLKAYALWFLASLLFLIHAIMIRDIVFILVQVVNLFAIGIIAIRLFRCPDPPLLTSAFTATLNTLGMCAYPDSTPQSGVRDLVYPDLGLPTQARPLPHPSAPLQ